ncbi:synaptic vesicle glycoprotein 2C [Trichonephila clavipes]|nr:synaptic vesicle glycoprotein 2C [Trichonephila clavipes]
MGAEFLFMGDNARPHRANIVDECLQSEDITRMDWPAYLPDLNPIDHVWDMLGRRIAALQLSPTCLPELRRALLDEWCNIPQDHIDNLILSMPRRCGCDIDFDVNFKLAELFYENLFAQLAILPGTLISSFLLDRIGRIKTLGFSLVLTGLSVGFLWFAESKEMIIAFEATFTFLSVFGWNALDVMSTEAYPANIR